MQLRVRTRSLRCDRSVLCFCTSSLPWTDFLYGFCGRGLGVGGWGLTVKSKIDACVEALRSHLTCSCHPNNTGENGRFIRSVVRSDLVDGTRLAATYKASELDELFLSDTNHFIELLKQYYSAVSVYNPRYCPSASHAQRGMWCLLHRTEDWP